MGNREMFCPHCGTTAVPRRMTKGSFAIEVALWLFFLVPGLIYSIWRLTSRYDGCRSCGQAGLIPPYSPRAVELRQTLPPQGRR